MPLSYRNYIGDGTVCTFDMDFPWLDQSHVKVRVDKRFRYLD